MLMLVDMRNSSRKCYRQPFCKALPGWLSLTHVLSMFHRELTPHPSSARCFCSEFGTKFLPLPEAKQIVVKGWSPKMGPFIRANPLVRV